MRVTEFNKRHTIFDVHITFVSWLIMNHELKYQNQIIEYSPAITGCNFRVVNLDQRCRALFQSAYLRGFYQRFWRRLLHKPYLLDFCQSLQNLSSLQNSCDKGILSVDLGCIRGSTNKHQDFDASFFPIREKSKQRWVRIASILITGESMPAIELVQVNDAYFVIDGHHRVSVAKALGMRFIDAHVCRVNLQVKGDCESRLIPTYAT